MKSQFVRLQSLAGLGICALFVVVLTSCRREPQPAPQQAQASPKPQAEATQPQSPEKSPSVFVAEDVDTALKMATTATGREQYTAIDDLGERHASASRVVPELEKLLDNNDAQVRWRSARALGDYGTQAQSAVPALRTLLTDKDPIVQYHAAVALGRISDHSDATVEALIKAVTSSDGRLARAAIAALRNIKPDPERVTAALENALESDDTAVTEYALEAVVERGGAAVPVLNAALRRPKTCYLACAAIEAIGPAAADTVPAIVELLGTTKHSQLLIQALLALASIGPAAQSATPQILPFLEHPTDATVPVAAAYALGSIGAADADAPLREALTKDNPFLQMIAAWALAKIHPDDESLVKQAVDKLTQGLASNDAGIRTAAARGLEMLHAPPELVAPALLAVANEPDPDAAANVVNALASLGEKIVPKASQALQKPELRELAVKVLTKLGPKASGAVGPLIDAIRGATPEFRTEIQFALGAIGPAAAPAASALAEALGSPDDGTRESALLALRQIGPGAKDAVPALISAAGGSDHFEALAAAWAVAAIAPSDADAAAKVMPLLSRGVTDSEEQNRMESVVALGDLGTAAKPAVGILTQTANEDSSAAVREAAQEALQRIAAGQ